jgi:hypothetical protein
MNESCWIWQQWHHRHRREIYVYRSMHRFSAVYYIFFFKFYMWLRFVIYLSQSFVFKMQYVRPKASPTAQTKQQAFSHNGCNYMGIIDWIIEWWMPHPVVTYINEHKQNIYCNFHLHSPYGGKKYFLPWPESEPKLEIRTYIAMSGIGTFMLWFRVFILTFIPT